MNEDLVTPRCAAEAIGCSYRSILLAIETGKVGAVRSGKRWLISVHPHAGIPSTDLERRLMVAFPTPLRRGDLVCPASEPTSTQRGTVLETDGDTLTVRIHGVDGTFTFARSELARPGGR